MWLGDLLKHAQSVIRCVPSIIPSFVGQVERQLENERAESKRKVEQVKRSMEDETADTKRKAKEVSIRVALIFESLKFYRDTL